MKKVNAILLSAVLALGLTACGGGGGAASSKAASGSAAGGSSAAAGGSWPSGDITIYSGYEAGSQTDANLVVLKDWLSEKTGKKVTIEIDKAGGGANLANKLAESKDDKGLTMMLFGNNNISNYIQGIWTVDPTDTSKFKAVGGFIQPNPMTGCMLLTQENSPYNTWDELEKYIKEHSAKNGDKAAVTVMDIPGKVMDSKVKALFYQRGLQDDVIWSPTSSADSASALLGDTIDIVMFEESKAASYLADSSNKVKAVLNVRPNKDYSDYAPDDKNLEIIKKVPTLVDVFGEKDAEKYNLPNASFMVVPASTPDDVVAQIKACIDGLQDVEKSTDEKSYYMRQRAQGGSSRYWDKSWTGDYVMKMFKDNMEKTKLFLK
ncbi:MAG: hypothetical protein IK152_08265 [Lachnospiraceae bacterium]|nr:hypothetical protein [Lachnospiraceae bacterium]